MDNKRYLDHPSDELLERFLLHHCSEGELEPLETHILVCDPCLSRVESLETEIAATKLALREWDRSEASKEQAENATPNRQHGQGAKFFLVSRWAVPAMVLALVSVFVPQIGRRRNQSVAAVELSVYRGSETTVAPSGRPLQLVLNTEGITAGPADVSLVNGIGQELWKGAVVIRNQVAYVSLAPISKEGAYYLRIYAQEEKDDLLREFAFEVK